MGSLMARPTEKYLFVGSPVKHPHRRLPFIITKYLDSEDGYCEVHHMTPEGEEWLYDETTTLYRLIVRQVYGVEIESWLKGGGMIKAPSGSTWDVSLEWLPLDMGRDCHDYAIPLGKTEAEH